jgi:hypothetical protein
MIYHQNSYAILAISDSYWQHHAHCDFKLTDKSLSHQPQPTVATATKSPQDAAPAQTSNNEVPSVSAQQYSKAAGTDSVNAPPPDATLNNMNASGSNAFLRANGSGMFSTPHMAESSPEGIFATASPMSASPENADTASNCGRGGNTNVNNTSAVFSPSSANLTPASRNGNSKLPDCTPVQLVVVDNNDKMDRKEKGEKNLKGDGENMNKPAAETDNNGSGFISARKAPSEKPSEKPVQPKIQKKTAGTGSGSGCQEKVMAEPKLFIIDKTCSSSGSQVVRGIIIYL